MSGRKCVVLLYDYLDTMALPWLKAGYDVVSVDGKHPDGLTHDFYHPTGAVHHKIGMWFEASRTTEQAIELARKIGPENVIMVFGFPECTYLTNAGNRWFVHPDDKHLPREKQRPHPLYPNRMQDRRDAVELARFVPLVAAALHCPVWAFENPRIGYLSTVWRDPDHWFDPCDYGGYLPEDHQHKTFSDVYPGRDAYRKPTGIWCSPGFKMPERKPVPPVGKDFPGWAKCGGKSDRTKEIRSATPEGFALAVFCANE